MWTILFLSMTGCTISVLLWAGYQYEERKWIRSVIANMKCNAVVLTIDETFARFRYGVFVVEPTNVVGFREIVWFHSLSSTPDLQTIDRISDLRSDMFFVTNCTSEEIQKRTDDDRCYACVVREKHFMFAFDFIDHAR
jgi:hypothetical protein